MCSCRVLKGYDGSAEMSNLQSFLVKQNKCMILDAPTRVFTSNAARKQWSGACMVYVRKHKQWKCRQSRNQISCTIFLFQEIRNHQRSRYIRVPLRLGADLSCFEPGRIFSIDGCSVRQLAGYSALDYFNILHIWQMVWSYSVYVVCVQHAFINTYHAAR